MPYTKVIVSRLNRADIQINSQNSKLALKMRRAVGNEHGIVGFLEYRDFQRLSFFVNLRGKLENEVLGTAMQLQRVLVGPLHILVDGHGQITQVQNLCIHRSVGVEGPHPQPSGDAKNKSGRNASNRVSPPSEARRLHSKVAEFLKARAARAEMI